MKTVFLICGARRSGKTNTLKELFGVAHVKRLTPMQLLERNVNGKLVYAVGLTSPQELTNGALQRKGESGFCKFEEVIKRIRKRIKKCERKNTVIDYSLLVPCTFYVEHGEINKNCIIEPKKWLEDNGFKVFLVYLRKEQNNPSLTLEITLMKSLQAIPIASNIDYKRQARELEAIIRKLDP